MGESRESRVARHELLGEARGASNGGPLMVQSLSLHEVTIHLVAVSKDIALRLGIAVGGLLTGLGAAGHVRRRDVFHVKDAELPELASLGGGALNEGGASEHGRRLREELPPREREREGKEMGEGGWGGEGQEGKKGARGGGSLLGSFSGAVR